MRVDEIDWTDRFWSKVYPEPMSGCWLWFGKPAATGYGQYTLDRKVIGAHRLAWSWLKGDPGGRSVHLHHTCANKLCVNVDHLQQVTVSEHQRLTFRGELPPLTRAHAEKTCCLRGHVFDKIEANGQRGCSVCTRIRNEAMRRRQGKHDRTTGLCRQGHFYDGVAYDGRGHPYRTCSTCRDNRNATRRIQRGEGTP